MSGLCSFLSRWFVPPRLYRVAHALLGPPRAPVEFRPLLARNREFRGRHAGQRCFILGTGPSINKMDLTPLSKEVCIALNSFHRHVDYARLAPQYHFFSGLAVHPRIGEASGDEYMRDLARSTGNATLLLHAYDAQHFEGAGYLVGRMAYYFLYDLPATHLREWGLDATRSLYQAESVSVMALQVALYMGFSRIYLLGVDHDWVFRFAERQSTHFYEPKTCPLERTGISDWDGLTWSAMFASYHRLWTQYESLGQYAKRQGVTIVNATEGGILDVFPRSDMGSLFAAGSADGSCGQ